MSARAARVVPSLSARVVARTPLLYAGGADPSVDRPAHVRAGSALVRLAGGRLAVIQDDASFLAFVDPASGRADALALPSEDGDRQFDEQRGNKAKKLDLEAALVLGHTLVAFGSGSSPVRQRVVLCDLAAVEGAAGGGTSGPSAGSDAGRGAHVRVVEATALYAQMRTERRFSGDELNVEGAARSGEDVIFFQRGNGAGVAVDATSRVSAAALEAYLRGDGPCPALRDIVQWELGQAGGTRLTFTDGASTPRGLAFLACAEDSPDATRDGPVRGVAVGRLDDRAGTAELAFVESETGAPLLDKCEGLVFDDGRAWVVVDRDDPTTPSELLELALGDGWR